MLFGWLKSKKPKQIYIKITLQDDNADVDCYWPKVTNAEEASQIAHKFASLIFITFNRNVIPSVRHSMSAYAAATGMDAIGRGINMLLDNALREEAAQTSFVKDGPLVPPSEAFKGD